VDEDLAGYMMQGDVYSIYFTTFEDSTGKKIQSIKKH